MNYPVLLQRNLYLHILWTKCYCTYLSISYTVRSESRCALIKVLEVMSTSVYTGLNPLNFIRKHFLQICIRKFAVHLSKVLEVMSTSVYTGLNPFNFIRKHFLQICIRKAAMHL
jgi:hypothetical protein